MIANPPTLPQASPAEDAHRLKTETLHREQGISHDESELRADAKNADHQVIEDKANGILLVAGRRLNNKGTEVSEIAMYEKQANGRFGMVAYQDFPQGYGVAQGVNVSHTNAQGKEFSGIAFFNKDNVNMSIAQFKGEIGTDTVNARLPLPAQARPVQQYSPEELAQKYGDHGQGKTSQKHEIAPNDLSAYYKSQDAAIGRIDFKDIHAVRDQMEQYASDIVPGNHPELARLKNQYLETIQRHDLTPEVLIRATNDLTQGWIRHEKDPDKNGMDGKNFEDRHFLVNMNLKLAETNGVNPALMSGQSAAPAAAAKPISTFATAENAVANTWAKFKNAL